MSNTKQIDIGSYGASTLSLISSSAGQFILLNSMRLARWSVETGAWVSLAPGWKVTAEGGGVRVALGASEGVIVSLS
jgi:hypothetical protein